MQGLELEVLQRLQWRVHPPTPQTFVKLFLLFLLVEEHEIYELATMLIRLSLTDTFFVPFKSSDIALACVLIAIERFQPEREASSIFSVQNTLLEVQMTQIRACRSRLLMSMPRQKDRATSDARTSSDNRTSSPVSCTTFPNGTNAHIDARKQGRSHGINVQTQSGERERMLWPMRPTLRRSFGTGECWDIRPTRKSNRSIP